MSDSWIEDELIPIDYKFAPFQSDRYFQVWKYHVSKCGLLIRSTPTERFGSLIDVHFGGVSFMVLRNSYEGLEIREGTPDEVTEVQDRYGVKFREGTRLNVLEPKLTSFVVSGMMQWYEDTEMDYDWSGVFGLGSMP